MGGLGAARILVGGHKIGYLVVPGVYTACNPSVGVIYGLGVADTNVGATTVKIAGPVIKRYKMQR